jgi:hypothetical protein
MKHWIVAACGVLGTLVAVPLAGAQAPASAAATQVEESAEYKRTIDQALEEYGLGHFEESRSLFERAHSLDPSARTLRGLGMVEFELRHYVAAEGYLKASLASERKPLTEDQRRAVADLLARTQQFVAKYELAVEPAAPPGMRVELDGKSVQLNDKQALALEAGEHMLRVSAPGAETRELHLDVRGGEQQTLRIVLEVKGGPADNVAPPPPVNEPLQRPYRSLGIGLTAGGGALVLAGGVLGGIALGKADGAETQKDSDADSAKTMALVSDVAIGVGAAAVVAGIVLWVWREKPKPAAGTGARLERVWPAVKVSF